MEFLSIDTNAHYTISEAFAYMRLLPSGGVFNFPAAVNPLTVGAVIALAVMVIVISLRPVKRRLIEAELDRPRKGKKYLFAKILLALSLAWMVLWLLNPWSNIIPYFVLINVGAVGLFLLMAFLYAVFPSPRIWDLDVDLTDELDNSYCDAGYEEEIEEEYLDEGDR